MIFFTLNMQIYLLPIPLDTATHISPVEVGIIALMEVFIIG